MLTAAHLHAIEADCERASAPVMRSLRAQLAGALPQLPLDDAEHAAALLLKLEHLERREQATLAGVAPGAFLAPELVLH